MATDLIPLVFTKSGGAAIEIRETAPGEQLSPLWLAGIAGQNMLINGDMRINQRGFAGGALAATVFGYDRWFADTGGANISVSAAGVITHSSGAICQAIEAPRGAFGVSVAVAVGDLSGGSLNVNVGGVTGTITAGTGRRYINLVTPSSTGTGNLLVKLTPASGSVTYREVSVVRGADMAAFDYAPISLELVAAQRYARRGFLQLRGAVSSSSGSGTWIATEMRAAPSVSFSSTNYLFGCSSIGAAPSATGVEIYVTAAGAYAFNSNYFFDSEITS
jgi:hypothetical protein